MATRTGIDAFRKTMVALPLSISQPDHPAGCSVCVYTAIE
jgi:hypothetical protein